MAQNLCSLNREASGCGWQGGIAGGLQRLSVVIEGRTPFQKAARPGIDRKNLALQAEFFLSTFSFFGYNQVLVTGRVSRAEVTRLP